VAGERDVVSYDDSNVVIGGTGDGNAQIGDSDTEGAVDMGIRDSVNSGRRLQLNPRGKRAQCDRRQMNDPAARSSSMDRGVHRRDAFGGPAHRPCLQAAATPLSHGRSSES
jgi:hypothetical protein